MFQIFGGDVCDWQASPSSGTPSQKRQRLTNLSQDQKDELASMSVSSDMDPGERKRQYSALRRAIYKDASPALVAKFSLATDGERLLADNPLSVVKAIRSSQ